MKVVPYNYPPAEEVPAVRCARCQTTGQLVLRDGEFVCSSERRCLLIQAFGEER